MQQQHRLNHVPCDLVPEANAQLLQSHQDAGWVCHMQAGTICVTPAEVGLLTCTPSHSCQLNMCGWTSKLTKPCSASREKAIDSPCRYSDCFGLLTLRWPVRPEAPPAVTLQGTDCSTSSTCSQTLPPIASVAFLTKDRYSLRHNRACASLVAGQWACMQ
jgi:hypothetical protein